VVVLLARFLEESCGLYIGNEYCTKGQKTKQNGQNQAREWKEYKKSKLKANLS
ncbi:hypothetical protein Tco_1479512, partial [Tanacetum coccineum]